jgi:tRNA_anti-like
MINKKTTLIIGLACTQFSALNLYAGFFDDVAKKTSSIFNEKKANKTSNAAKIRTLKYSNGNIFKGTTSGGKPAKGIITNKDGEKVFEGGFFNGRPYNGTGTLKYSNGYKFKGTISRGKPSKGTLVNSNGNGNIFKGQTTANGMPYRGTLSGKDGNKLFEGTFSNGKPFKGVGTISYEDGSKFKGTIDWGRPSKGIRTDKNGKTTFKGLFRNGKPYKGIGLLPCSNGTFEGTIINGKPNQGTLNDKDGNKLFEGLFRRGKPYKGKGSIVYSNGDKFTGLIEDGKPKRGVTYNKNNVKTFDGAFKYGEPYEGKGMLQYTNGNLFKGVIAQGRPYKGTIVDKGGKKIKDILTRKEFEQRSKQYKGKYKKALLANDMKKIEEYEKFLTNKDKNEVANDVRSEKLAKQNEEIAKANAIRAKRRKKRLQALQKEIGCPQIKPVSIHDVLNAYKENEIRADNIYKNKYIEVTGIVSSIKKGLLGDLYITLGTGRRFEIPQIQAFFEATQKDSLLKLHKGQKISIVGKVDGLMMNVIMKKCIIE